MESYFSRCLDGPPFDEHEDKRYEFIRLLTFKDWPRDSPVFPLKLSNAGFCYTGVSDTVICYKCGITKSDWQWGDCPDIVHRQLSEQCDFLCSGCSDNIPFNHELEDNRSDSILERLDSIGQDNPETNLHVHGAGILNTADENVYEGDAEESYARSVVVPKSRSEPSLGQRGCRSTSETHCSGKEKTSVTSSNSGTKKALNHGLLDLCHQKDQTEERVKGCLNTDDQVVKKGKREVTNSANFAGNVSAAESVNSASLSAGASCPNSAPSSLHTAPTRSCACVDHDRYGACASAPNLSTSVPKSKSDGHLSRDLSVATGAANGSIRNAVRSGRKVNATDSTVAAVKANKAPLAPDARNDENLPSGSGKECSKKKSACKDKSKSSNTKQKLSSGSSGNQEQSNMDRSRGRDIPPPTGAEIGPMRFERNRLETFKKWPRTACVPPAELARCGFHFTGSADRVQCVFCKGILRNWEEGDRPHIEHRKHFPNCPFVLGLSSIGNVPLPLDQQAQSSEVREGTSSQPALNVIETATNLEGLGIVTDRPKHPRYAIESQRLASFQGWPAYKHQTPQQLAEAGFWFAGFNDNVKCFYCDGGLRNWEPADQPWVEHAHWFPQCPFVKQVKGQEFIRNVVREKGSVDLPILSQPSRPQSVTSSPHRHVIEEREVRARMDRAHVRVVEGMGVTRDVIMKAIRERLRTTGDDFPSSTALLEAVFAMQETNQEQSTADEEVSSTANEADSDTRAVDTDHVTKPAVDVPNSSQDDCQNAVEEPIADNNPKVQDEDLLKENLELKEQRLCKICMATDANVVFLPCGHLVSCAGCAPALQTCPICRETIKGTVRTYMA